MNISNCLLFKHPSRGRGKSSPSHYGPPRAVAQEHAVTVGYILCQQMVHLAMACPLCTTRRWWTLKYCGLTTGKSMKNTRVSCATYKAWCGTLSTSTADAHGTCSPIGACSRISPPMLIYGFNVQTDHRPRCLAWEMWASYEKSYWYLN